MRLREYLPNDLDALRRLHAAQGFGYPFPDLDCPLFVTKLVLEEEAADAFAENGEAQGREDALVNSLPEPRITPGGGRIAMAVLLRLTAEAYLLHDPAVGTPRQRWQRFLCLHQAAQNVAAARGLNDVQAFLPPRIATAFGRRLARLGWTRDPWPCYSKQIWSGDW